MGSRTRALLGIALLFAASGCGHTFVIRVPEMPSFFGGDDPPAPVARAQSGKIEDCTYMSVMIDYSREGNPVVGERVASAMAREFKKQGLRVTRSSSDAYWSLMILASENSRKDGYVFSAMFSARSMNEGHDPGVTVFERDGDEPAQPGKTEKIPTLYNGLSYGPYAVLEDQARGYVQQAYSAVYPFAQRMCAYEANDRKRGQSIDEQIPAGAAPL
jgi:hypothetical protein